MKVTPASLQEAPPSRGWHVTFISGLPDFIDILQTLRSHLREEEHILDSRRICHKHCKTVDSHTES